LVETPVSFIDTVYYSARILLLICIEIIRYAFFDNIFAPFLIRTFSITAFGSGFVGVIPSIGAALGKPPWRLPDRARSQVRADMELVLRNLFFHRVFSWNIYF